HNHMLRTYVNGTWGEPVGNDGLAVSGLKVTDNYSFTLPQGWNAERCHVVAFVYHTETLEILQAEEVGVQ
ncbi:MAG: Omp28-related outer membrane protein, partial [Bacteroidales bacterium]|nr:Omp28-related outer membrane protein [Bacteroidales bacterium]